MIDGYARGGVPALEGRRADEVTLDWTFHTIECWKFTANLGQTTVNKPKSADRLSLSLHAALHDPPFPQNMLRIWIIEKDAAQNSIWLRNIFESFQGFQGRHLEIRSGQRMTSERRWLLRMAYGFVREIIALGYFDFADVYMHPTSYAFPRG